MNIGSIKLQNIFREYMENYFTNDDYEKSNIKSYIINFLLIDNNCFDENFQKYVKELQESFIIDNVFIKLNELYHNNTSNDQFYFESLQILMNKNKNWKEKQDIDKKLAELKRQKQFRNLKDK